MDKFWHCLAKPDGRQCWCIECTKNYRLEKKQPSVERPIPQWRNQKEYHAWYYRNLPLAKKLQYYAAKRAKYYAKKELQHSLSQETNRTTSWDVT